MGRGLKKRTFRRWHLMKKLKLKQTSKSKGSTKLVTSFNDLPQVPIGSLSQLLMDVNMYLFTSKKNGGHKLVNLNQLCAYKGHAADDKKTR